MAGTGINYDGTVNEVKYLKIAGNNVTEVTRDTAQVGCTKVTRAEAEALLAEMNKAPEKFDFNITPHVSGDNNYVSFFINEQHAGWAAGSSKRGEQYYGALQGFGTILSLSLCLGKQKAEKLMRFLAAQLGFDIQRRREVFTYSPAPPAPHNYAPGEGLPF